MKIAVFHNLPSGGAKRALSGFLKYLTGSGHTVDVFVPSTADEGFLSLAHTSRSLEVFPVKKTLSGFLLNIIRLLPHPKVSLVDLERTQRAIGRRINDGEYDIVLSEQDQYTFSPSLLSCIQKPTVYFCQQPSRFQEEILQKTIQKSRPKNVLEWVRRTGGRYFAHRITGLDKKYASFAKYILANSYFSRETILRHWGLNARVCYLGVDTEVFRKTPTTEKNHVLSVGSCIPGKGFDFIVASLGLLDSKIRPALRIVSNAVYSPWKKYLEKTALQNHVDLQIRTLATDEELVNCYNDAKLVLYSPYLEPFGLVPLEAMACGTPVIAVKEGGVRESVVHKQTGLLTERDEAMFADAVATLLADKGERDRMGQNGIAAIRDFWTLEHAGERLLWHLRRRLETHEGDQVK